MTPEQRTTILAKALLETERFDRYISDLAEQLYPPGQNVDDVNQAMKDLLVLTLAAQGMGAMLAAARTLFQNTQPDLMDQPVPAITKEGLSLRASIVVGAPDTPEELA